MNKIILLWIASWLDYEVNRSTLESTTGHCHKPHKIDIEDNNGEIRVFLGLLSLTARTSRLFKFFMLLSLKVGQE
jgi:hypothetical protein